MDGYKVQFEKETEAVLRAGVRAASLRLDAAKTEFCRIAAQVSDVSDELSSGEAVAQAAALQNRATEELALALAQFSQFLETRASRAMGVEFETAEFSKVDGRRLQSAWK